MESIITARKFYLIEVLFAFFNRRSLRRHFNQIWTKNFEQLKAIDPNYPVLFFANHSCWWDGLIVFYITRDLLKFDGYLMSIAKQLRKYSFFRWIGAFSIDRESPISAYRSLEYTVSLLSTKNKQTRAVWIFPQGGLLANDTRPIEFLRGLSWVIKHVPKVQLISVAFRYEFINEQLPEIFLTFNLLGQLPENEIKKSTVLNKKLEEILTKQLDELKEDVMQRKVENYQPALGGKLSINIMYDKFRRLIGLKE